MVVLKKSRFPNFHVSELGVAQISSDNRGTIALYCIKI